jgi:hypothetical protein
MAVKSNVSKLFTAADAALDHAPFAIDEFEFGETQQKADMIEPLARGLCGDLFIFAHEGRQFELTQIMGEQNLRRRRAGNRSRRRQLRSRKREPYNRRPRLS